MIVLTIGALTLAFILIVGVHLELTAKGDRDDDAAERRRLRR